MTQALTNWAGNVRFRAARLHRPGSVAELQRLVAGSSRLRVLGTGHSFSAIADTTGDLVSVAGLPVVMALDAEQGSVTVSAGVSYGELARYLCERGYALPNLGSLPHISVAGACATGTHGSGDAIGNLATAVRALDLVTAGGDLLMLTRPADPGVRADEPDPFAGAVVALGALGVVTRLSLDVLPAFDLRQYVYEDLPRERLDDSFDEIFAAGYSVSVFTDWRPGPVSQVWLKQRVPAGKSGQPEPALVDPGWLGARLADGPRHPVRGMSAENTTQQLGVPGPWHERLPHFRPEFRPSTASELQSEFLLPREHTGAAFRAIEQIRDVITPVLQVSEIRTVAADGLWLSPSYGRDTACLHFTWTDDLPAVIAALTEVESRLAPLGARPHWGKLFGVGDLSDRYERMDDFLRLASDFDPQRKFSNDFTAACLGW